MIDVVQVVEKLDSLGLIRSNRIINEYYSIHCPIHNQGQEKKPSFGILINEQIKNGKLYPQGWCHCFSCSYINTLPGLITDILSSKSISKNGIEWLTENIPGFDGVFDFDFLVPQHLTEEFFINWSTSKSVIQSLQDMQKPLYQYIEEEELATYRFTVPYMYERGLTDDIIEKYDVGYDGNFRLPGRREVTPTLTFPVRDLLGRTCFIYRRGVKHKIFSMPTGLSKPVYGLYELDRQTKRLVIAESILNALKVVSFGQPAVALMSTGNSQQINQIRQLGVREIILGFDDDEAGHRAEYKWKKALSDVAIVWSYRGYPKKDDGTAKDLNDLTKSEFQSLELV